jgi:hypothetical protein
MKTLIVLLFGIAASASAQECDPEPSPIVVQITARDSVSGQVIYTRRAYLFFSEIDAAECPQPHRLTAEGDIAIRRVIRQDGERCDDVLPTIIETGHVHYDFCRPGPVPSPSGSPGK